MTSSIPLSEEEKAYIEKHLDDGPGRIAFDLGRKFRRQNRGYRGFRTIQKYIYRKHGQPVTLMVKVQPWVMAEAREKGMEREDLIVIAEAAIKERIIGG
jgi:hypothetical protein